MRKVEVKKDANYDDMRKALNLSENVADIEVIEGEIRISTNISDRNDDYIVLYFDIEDFLTAIGKELKGEE